MARVSAPNPRPVARRPRSRRNRPGFIGVLFRALLRVVLGLVVVVVAAIGIAVAAAAWRESSSRVALAPPTGRFVQAHDLELYVQEGGPPSGQLVLLRARHGSMERDLARHARAPRRGGVSCRSRRHAAVRLLATTVRRRLHDGHTGPASCGVARDSGQPGRARRSLVRRARHGGSWHCSRRSGCARSCSSTRHSAYTTRAVRR